jgi:hypothetical protein
LRWHRVAFLARVCRCRVAAVDAVPEKVAPAACAVVSDDRETILLTFYAADGAACGLELDPVHAVGLATRLLEAASIKLR